MTKRIDEFQAQEKEYTGTLLLGATTPSFDLETEIDQRFETDHLTVDEVLETARKLTGDIDKIATDYSALKIDGERSYEKASSGAKPAIRPSSVRIRWARRRV